MANNDNWRSNSGAPVNDPKYPSSSTQDFIGTRKDHSTWIIGQNGQAIDYKGHNSLKGSNMAAKFILDVFGRDKK